MTGLRAALTLEDAEINAALDRVSEAGGDTDALMAEIGAAMLMSVQRRFERETGPGGEPWPRHAPRTAKARAKRKSRRNGAVTPKLLRESNRLYASISSETSENSAAVGTNLIYAAIHQTGGAITQYSHSRKVRFRTVAGRLRFARKAHKRAFERPVTFGTRTIVIPARPYLGFSDQDRTEILAISEAHFEEAATVGREGGAA